MIRLRIDIGKSKNFALLNETLEKHVGVQGKHWFWDLCNHSAYEADTDEELHEKWNTMYLIDISIRSHKKATLFSLVWNH